METGSLRDELEAFRELGHRLIDCFPAGFDGGFASALDEFVEQAVEYIEEHTAW